MNERVGVIGAGPAGLAAAYTLGKLGLVADVFETDSAVGGMAKTIDLWGQKVDFGPHRFFSTDARVNRLWLELVGTKYRMVSRQTRILYNGQFFDYPLRLANSLSKLGSIEAVHCLLSCLRQQIRCKRTAASFEDWVCGRFGRRIYEIFFRSYSEKLWGIPCAHLDADFAAQRIRRLSLYEAVRNALAHGRGNRHATLVNRFAYPLGGTGIVCQKMADAISARGGSVNLRMPAQRFTPHTDGRIEVELASGERHLYGHVVSTIPLSHLVRGLPGAPESVRSAASSLRFRSTIIVYLRVESTTLFPDQWIYIHAPELALGRVTNFRNWVPELYGNSRDTILSLELWCDPDDLCWHEADSRHIEQASADLRKTGLIQSARILDGHIVRVPFCYPVYRIGYRNHVNVIQNYLQTIPGLHVIGRCGSFKYNNQDHSLLMGILAAEKIALDCDHDLWSINADDIYQETAIVDETGLVLQAP
jgi:protoporphyrinogen oxidase